MPGSRSIRSPHQRSARSRTSTRNGTETYISFRHRLRTNLVDTIPFMTDVSRQTLEQSYEAFKAKWWPATTQSPEIIAAASYALRSGQFGIKANRVVLTGLSQTGGVTRRFITHSSHLRLPDGRLPFEGFIPCQSGGAALPDVPGAKIIELLGESEFQSVRLPCGVSGQILGVSHRRDDSDSFRLYEIAGWLIASPRYPSDIDTKRWSVAELNGANGARSLILSSTTPCLTPWNAGRVATLSLLRAAPRSRQSARAMKLYGTGMETQWEA